MVSKNNHKLIAEKNRKNEKQRFALRKLNVGVASVLLGVTFSVYGGGQLVAHADTTTTSDQPEEAKTTNEQSLADQSQVTLNNNAQTDNSVTASETNKATTNQQPVGGVATKSTDATDTPAATTNNEKVTANEATAQKTTPASQGQSTNADQNQNSLDGTRQVLQNISNTASYRNNTNNVASLFGASFVATPTGEETTVTDAQGLIDAIQNGTATTINIGADIDLGTKDTRQTHIENIKNYRDIVIKSADDNKKYAVDFNGYSFNMAGKNGVTFSNLDLYDRAYWSPIENAKEYTFDNVTFHGSQLVYTDTSVPNVTVNFKGNVTAEAVNGYTSPINNKNQTTQGSGNQQIIQFRSGNNAINFAPGSNVNLKTYGSNVIEIDGGTTAINLQSNNGANGAQVTLEPHTQTAPESNFMGVDGVGRGIASQGTTNINIDKSSNLTISLNKLSTDKWLSGALYLTKGATIENKGTLNVNVDGAPYGNDVDAPIYISGDSKINVNGGQFNINATNLGNYSGTLLASAGTSTISINHHGTFDVTGDGAQATGVSLSSGSTFTSTQPELFNISMPDGATAIKNGKVQFQGVKTSADGQPIGEIDITYAANGTPTVTKVTSYDEATTTATRTAGNSAKNKINLIAAGEEVDLKDITFTKDADGNYIMSGNANTAAGEGAYVYVSVNGTVRQVSTNNDQTLWTAGETGDPTSSQVPYTAETGADGKFSVNLGKLNDNNQVSLYAAKDFVTSDTDTKTVSDWMTSSYRDQLQKLVDEAPNVEAGSNYINATNDLKAAYTNAISDGSTLLQNTSATSEQLEAAANAIVNAKTALNGDFNKVKQDLQTAVDAASDFEKTSATYYNADTTKQRAYTNAVAAGSTALNDSNATVDSLTTALKNINDAKAALDGKETSKQALQNAVDESKDVKNSNNYINADPAAKTAYDDAVTAAQSILDKNNATQAQVTQALQDLNSANGKLNGDAKTDAANRQALEAAVKDAPNVRNTPAYYNGDSKDQEAYNKAVTDGQAVSDNQDATPTDVKNALDAITNAKAALDGQPTNKEALQNAVNNSKDVKDSNNYTNADQNEKTAYDDAVTAAQSVLDKNNATQAQVNQALQDLNAANGNLNGDAKTEAANKQALEVAVKDAPNVRNTPAYYNGDSKDQEAYNKAITDGQAVLDNKDATPADVKNALDTITAAKKALDGQPTNKEALQNAVDKSKDVKDSNNYTNADQNEKTAYDSAVTAAQNVLDNNNATQAQVNQALQDLNAANSNLNGDVKTEAANKAALEDAVKEAPTVEKTSSAYYNGTETTQNAYKSAIEAGQKVLDSADATADQINSALSAINNAKNALDGEKTDKSELQTLVDASNGIKSSNNYTNADEAQKTAYDKAITDAQTVLSNDNATQTQVNDAVTAINTANKALNGDAKTDAANRQALEAAVKDAPNVRNTPTYYNGDSKVQDAYNNAITDGQAVLDNKDATPAEVKNALDVITAAKKALDGQPTNKQDLQDAVNKSKGIKDSNNYANADQNEKTAYDNAVTAAQGVLDNENATQAQVTQALKDLNTANSKLNGDAKTDAANRVALEEAVKEAPTVEKTSSKYYNGTEKAQNDYKNAVSEGQKVLDNTNATANQIKTALDNINAAKGTLDGDPTDKTTLQNSVSNAVDLDKSNADAQAKQDYTDALDKANQVLADPNATQQAVNEANTALTNAKTALDNSSALQNAKDALQQAVDAKSTTEKTPAYYNADSAKQQAYDTAISAGTDALNAQNPTVESLTEALNKINDAKNALDGKATDISKLNAAVDNANTVKASSDYKDASADIQKQYDDAVKAGQQLLDPTTAPSPLTQADVDRAAKAITDAQNALTTSATTNVENTKEKAATDLTDAVTKAKEAIDQDTNLTDQERDAAKAQVDADAKTAQEAINKATTNDDVTSATNTGKLAIDKTVANAAIDNAVAGKKAEISNAKDLSSDNVNALNNEVDQAANDAKNTISSATTEKAVNKAQTDGVDKINAIDVATTAAKDKAKSDIDQAANDAKKAIDDNKDLTDDQKTAAKDQIDQDATKAKDNINNAKNDKDAENANNAGQLAIAKDGAKAAIQGALNKKLNEIDSASALTSDEKAKLTNDANTAATNANDAIDAATTLAEVTSAQTTGIQNIENVKVPAESATKSAADKAIDEALANKQAEINKSTTLTDEEKANLNKQAQSAANTAKQNIANAKTDSTVATAKDDGVAAIDSIKVPANSTAKDKAKSNITDAADKAKQAIDQDNNLTNDQKQAAKDQVDTDAKNAQDAIDNAKTDADVNNAADNGKLAIDKTVADAAIDNAVAGKIKDVKAPLTTDEQKTLTDLIKETGENAKQNIANATTSADVTTAQNNGVKAINDINIPTNSSVKDNATTAIDKALQNKTNEINNATNITAQEKQDLIKQATDAANTAKDNIKNAANDSAVITAQTNGEKAIADVTIPGLSDIKKESTDLINKTLDKKKDEINNASNLSDDEKQQLINDATKAATDAINNINNAKTNDEAKAAADTGVQNIENISIPSLDDAKKNANQAIDDALNAKTNEINNASNLNDQEKQGLINKATDAANTAKDNINSATTNDAVKKAEEDGVNSIKGVNFTNLDDAKKAANNAIDNALTNKTNEINNASNLSQDEKQDLISKATDAATTAKDNISKATTNDAVNDAQNKGIEGIANVTVPGLDEAKQNAINAIKQVQEAKNKQISDAKNLNADQQKSLTDQVNKIANDAIAQINDSSVTTNDSVATIRDNAIDQITNLFIPTLDGAQDDATNAIETAKNTKIDEINNAKNLSDQEKQDLTDQVNKAADDATKAIKNATTNDAVKNAETKGLNDINNITVPSLAEKQQAAIQELSQARDTKLAAIDNASTLTTDEKNSLKDQVQGKYSQAVANITQAATDDAVTTAKDAGIEAINSVTVPSKSVAKQAAKDAVAKAAEAKDAAIDKSSLTDEEKATLKQQVTDAQEAANKAIDNATTNAEVTNAQNKGIQAIAGVTVPSLAETKQAAINAIKQAQEAKNQQISGAKNLSAAEQKALTDQVDKIADDAITQINDSATTNDAVTATRDNAIKQINDLLIPTISTAREQAKAEITKDAEAAKQDIDKDTNLTADEKQTAKDQIDADAKNVQSTIDNAATDSDVNKAVNDGQLTIAKAVANAAIDNAVAGKKAEIANAPLTNTEKQALNDRVDQAAQTAKNNIAQATTTGEVANAQENGVKAINGIEVPTVSAVKNKAQSNLTSVVNTAKEAIDQDTNLTDAQKQVFKDQIDTDAKNAQEAINNAKTDTDVNNAIDNGKLAIAKDVANAAIANAVAGKKAEIAASELTDVQKAALNNQVDGLAQQAQEAIKQATTESAVTTAMEQGIAEINRVEIPAADNQSSSNSTDNGATNSSNTTDNANKNDETQANTTDVTQTANQANGQRAERQATAIVSSEQQPTSQKSDANKKAELPQTGNDANNLSVAGLAVVSLMGLFGLKKRSRKDN